MEVLTTRLHVHRTPDPETLIRRHQAEIWRFLRLLGSTPVEADDLTQETFLAVLRRPFEERGEASTRAYLRTVARRLFLKAVARDRHRYPSGDLDAVEAVWAGSFTDGGDGRVEALRACLELVDDRGRRALQLRYRDGASRMEMARHLELSEGGVKNLLQRLKARLRDCIERRLAHA